MTGTRWSYASTGPSTACSRQRSARWSRVGSKSRDGWCTYLGSRALGEVRPVRRALLAVYDRRGLVTLAKGLADQGRARVSAGGTVQALSDAGIAVTPVERVTGFPEMLGGRVKTLRPKIHAGILADRRKPEHVEELKAQAIEPFDLVVVNLYPFRETVAGGAPVDEVIEKIDIGGPAMVRAAAKNFESVGVMVSPERYPRVVEELR